MAENRGKQFETVIKDAFRKVPGVSIDRFHDQMSGFAGSRNVSDFVVYKEPYEVYVECKTTRGNNFRFSNITDGQWSGLLEKSKIKGVFAGILCWWIDYDTTLFIPIQMLYDLKNEGLKSIRYDLFTYPPYKVLKIKGEKKRVFFDYDLSDFVEEVAKL
ncbi:MAG: Holliday junction resolvase RecU [Bacteroidales bacterium]|nr:Holliday junction resolvase RecU [Bacteroidales bacterium]